MLSLWNRALPWLVYPSVGGGAVTLLVGMVGTGRSYWLVAPPILAATALAVILLERVRPHAAVWRTDHGDARTDLAHFAANLATSQLATAGYAGFHHATGGIGALWPFAWPFVAQFLLALLLVDLGLYGVHRASHGAGWLWRLHAIHHSPRRVYWVNGQRRHLVHEILEGSPGLLVLALLGAPPAIVGSAFAAVTIHLFLQHANIEYRLGPLTRLFAVAELHRWHHQRRWQDVQGNYAAVFSFWDYLFGTTLPQRGVAPLDVGMDDEDIPCDWRGQMAWPFRRGRRRAPEAAIS